MGAFTVRSISEANDSALPALLPLFSAMHAEMAGMGTRSHLVEGGAALWLRSTIAGLERFGRLVIVESNEAVIGFAQIALRLAPDHLGGARTGHIAHVYVAPSFRRLGIARELVVPLEAWAKEREVNGIDLHVVHGNAAGLAFWRALGYTDEWTQLRKG